MTEREFIILSANKDMFGKYGVEVVDGRRKMEEGRCYFPQKTQKSRK